MIRVQQTLGHVIGHSDRARGRNAEDQGGGKRGHLGATGRANTINPTPNSTIGSDNIWPIDSPTPGANTST